MKYNIIGGIINLAAACGIVVGAFLPLYVGSITILASMAIFVISLFFTIPGGDCEYYRPFLSATIVLTAVLSVFGIMLGVGGMTTYYSLEELNAVGNARIVDIVEHDKHSSYLKVETENGARYTVTLHGSFSGIIGDTVIIRYNKDEEGSAAYGETFTTDLNVFEAVIESPNPIVVKGATSTHDTNATN